MTPTTAEGTAAPPAAGNAGRVVLAVVLAILALAFLAFAILMIVVPAGNLPGWLGHEMTPHVNLANPSQITYTPSTGHHPYRVIGSLIAAVVFAIGAWFSLRYKGKATTADR